MFYSQDILQKRGGRFGIVWIAATNGTRLTRREFASVNVNKTSDDIVDYIFLRARPRYPGGARPRLSLYLASQLMFGLTKVYGKQEEYLLADLTVLSSKCRLSLTSLGDIDLRVAARSDLVTNPDCASLSSRYGPYYDPNFGVFKPDVMLDIISEMKMWDAHVLSSRIELSPSIPEEMKEGLPLASPPHTVSSSEITMIEEVEPPRPQVAAEDDLPLLSDEELERLMHMTRQEDPLLGVSTGAAQVISTPIHHPSLTEPSNRDLLPPLEETPIGDVYLGDLIPEPTPRLRQARPQSPGITPIAPSPEKRRAKRKRSSLALELSPTVTPSPRRARHRRRLPFIDRDIQIPKAVLRENMTTSRTILRRFELPDVDYVPVADLFNRPARKEFRNTRLVHLWSRNAYPVELTETSSDVEHPIWTVPDLSLERSTTSEEEMRQTLGESVEMERHQDVTGQSIELGREMSSTMEKSRLLDQTPLSIHVEKEEHIEKVPVVGEQPPRKRSKVSVGTSSEDEVAEFQGDLDLDLSDLARGLPSLGKQLEALPEKLEEEPMLTETVIEKPTLFEEDLISFVSDQTALKVYTTFKDICPTSTTSRLTAAKTFGKVVEFCGAQMLKCRQDEPYGNILIARGLAW